MTYTDRGPSREGGTREQLQLWWALWAGASLANVARLRAEGDAEVVLDVLGLLLMALSTPFAVWTVRLFTLRVTQPRAGAVQAEALAG